MASMKKKLLIIATALIVIGAATGSGSWKW